MELKEIIQIFEKRVPPALQEKWDHGGLNLGSKSQKVNSVLFSYDICHEVVAFARKNNCQLIMSHHPFRMQSAVSLNLDSYEGKIISECIKHGISLYSSHTNHDASPDSLNFHYLNKLKCTAIEPLTTTGLKLYKLVVYVPQDHTAKVMQALFQAGAGGIGNYSECSFRSTGIGSFKGNASSQPTIGKKLKRSEVAEDRLEVLVTQLDLKTAVAAMHKAHPYEEVAYDVLELTNKIQTMGLGAVGQLPKPISKNNIIRNLKKLFKAKHLRFISSSSTQFKKIAICTGAGASLIDVALLKNADLFITGDVKYHQAIEAKRHDLAIADVGHFYSEIESVLLLKNIFSQLFNKQLKYHVYKGLKDAFEFY